MVVDSPSVQENLQIERPATIPGIYMPVLYRGLLSVVMFVCVLAIAAPIALFVFGLLDYHFGSNDRPSSGNVLVPMDFMADTFLSIFAVIAIVILMFGVKLGAMAGLLLGMTKRSLVWYFGIAIVAGAIVVAAGQFVESRVGSLDLAVLQQSNMLDVNELRPEIISTLIALVAVSVIVRYASALCGIGHRLGTMEMTLGLVSGVILFTISTRYEFAVTDVLNSWPQALTGLGIIVLSVAIPGLLLDRMQAGYD